MRKIKPTLNWHGVTLAKYVQGIPKNTVARMLTELEKSEPLDKGLDFRWLVQGLLQLANATARAEKVAGELAERARKAAVGHEDDCWYGGAYDVKTDKLHAADLVALATRGRQYLSVLNFREYLDPAHRSPLQNPVNPYRALQAQEKGPMSKNLIAAAFTRKSRGLEPQPDLEAKAEAAFAARQEALDRLQTALNACTYADEGDEEPTEEQRCRLQVEREHAAVNAVIANDAFMIAALDAEPNRTLRESERTRHYFTTAWRALEYLGECPPLQASAEGEKYVHGPEYLRTLEKWRKAKCPEPIEFIREYAKAGGLAD